MAAPIDDTHVSTSSTMIPFSTSSASVGRRFSWIEVMVPALACGVGDGSASIGGTSLLGSVADGDASYLRHRPIWVSPSFVGMGRQ